MQKIYIHYTHDDISLYRYLKNIIKIIILKKKLNWNRGHGDPSRLKLVIRHIVEVINRWVAPPILQEPQQFRKNPQSFWLVFKDNYIVMIGYTKGKGNELLKQSYY